MSLAAVPTAASATARLAASATARTVAPNAPRIALPTVSAVSVEDVDQIVTLDASLIATGWSRGALADELRRDDRCWYAARVGDEVVGFAGMGLLAGDAHVLAVGVVGPWRGRGVGSRLVETLVAAAADAAATGVTLEVRAGNTAARRLYRRAGFVEEGTRPGYYADGEDAVIAWRRWA